jgi:hypothetical protein
MSHVRRPEGAVTRGTTAPNRLRRADRWIAGVYGPLLRRQDRPLVVDLGYGASPVTTAELVTRLGGFELPVERPPTLIRAFNVLRQYAEAEAWAAWGRMSRALAPDGVLIEGTCGEIGRRAVWVALHRAPDRASPRTITFAAHLGTLDRPSDLAERLPKTLIHRNVPGERVHDVLSAFDRTWAAAAPYSAFGARQRWVAAVELLAREQPVHVHAPLGGRARWRLGEVTLPWTAVTPADQEHPHHQR